MPHPVPSQRQVEFTDYVRTRGPLTGNQATEYVRLNNMLEPDPYSLSLRWLQAAIDAHEIQIYRDARNTILYAMPKLKKLDKPRPAPPIQRGLFHPYPPYTAQPTPQPAKPAALTEQPKPEKETTA